MWGLNFLWDGRALVFASVIAWQSRITSDKLWIASFLAKTMQPECFTYLTMQKKNHREIVSVASLLRYFFGVVAAARFLKRSTRPPWSRTFSSPVKNGWHELQISTSIFGIVEPTTNFSPHEQVTCASWLYAGWIAFFIMGQLYQKSHIFARFLVHGILNWWKIDY